jgi:SAM-dependent methyltransferase
MCPICKNSKFIIIGSPYLNPKISKIIKKDYKVVKCTVCNLYYVEPSIDFLPDEWKFLYNSEYFQPMTNRYENNRAKKRKERLAKITQYSTNEIKNFLDVGCGEGFCLLEAENRGWNAYGLDITDHRVKDAKKNSINFINTDLLSSKFPDNFFDAIYLDSVLEHVINPLDYLLEIKRILKTGGILYIGVPNENSLFNDFKKILYWFINKKVSNKIKPFKSPYHVVGFNKISLDYALNKAKFKILKIRNFARRMEFLYAKALTKDFFKLLLILPIYLLSVPIRREVYLEAYIQK